MKPFRITIGRMMAAIVLAAVLFAGLRACMGNPETSEVIATVLLIATALPIVYATRRAFERKSSLFWRGFAAVGCLHLIMIPLFWDFRDTNYLSHKLPLLMTIDAIHDHYWPTPTDEEQRYFWTHGDFRNDDYLFMYYFGNHRSQHRWRQVCYPPMVLSIAFLFGSVLRQFDRSGVRLSQSQPTGEVDEAPH